MSGSSSRGARAPTPGEYIMSALAVASHLDQEMGIIRGQWGGMGWDFGVNRCKLSYIEWINNKVLLYSTGNYIQYPGTNHNGKEYKKECIYVYN